jgi:RNA polymerase sigma-70 factor (ECF subfamily)
MPVFQLENGPHVRYLSAKHVLFNKRLGNPFMRRRAARSRIYTNPPFAPLCSQGGHALAQAGGEPPCFDAVFARYHGQVYRYLLGMVGQITQAQALTQDTFVIAYTALRRRPNQALPAWLYRIATDLAFDALGDRRRLTGRLGAPCAARCLASEADLPPLCAERAAVRAALARLSLPERACLLLRARDGLSIGEIAFALRLSSGRITRTLYLAKERFRAAYPVGERPHADQ